MVSGREVARHIGGGAHFRISPPTIGMLWDKAMTPRLSSCFGCATCFGAHFITLQEIKEVEEERLNVERKQLQLLRTMVKENRPE